MAKEKEVTKGEITFENLVNEIMVLKGQMAFLKVHTHNAITGKPDIPMELI